MRLRRPVVSSLQNEKTRWTKACEARAASKSSASGWIVLTGMAQLS